jgi:hypothetical protein
MHTEKLVLDRNKVNSIMELSGVGGVVYEAQMLVGRKMLLWAFGSYLLNASILFSCEVGNKVIS